MNLKIWLFRIIVQDLTVSRGKLFVLVGVHIQGTNAMETKEYLRISRTQCVQACRISVELGSRDLLFPSCPDASDPEKTDCISFGIERILTSFPCGNVSNILLSMKRKFFPCSEPRSTLLLLPSSKPLAFPDFRFRTVELMFY